MTTQKFGNAHFRGDVRIDGKLTTPSSGNDADVLTERYVVELVHSSVNRLSDTITHQIRASSETLEAFKCEVMQRLERLEESLKGVRTTSDVASQKVRSSSLSNEAFKRDITQRLDLLEKSLKSVTSSQKEDKA